MIKVAVDTPPWFINPRNTDWNYMRSLSGICEFAPSLQFEYPESILDAVRESLHHLRGKFPGERLLLRKGKEIQDCANNCDVVISHRRFPLCTRKPTIWQHSVIDPEMLVASGHNTIDIEHQYRRHEPIFRRCTTVLVSTQAERVRHQQRFPELANKFVAVPFFLPKIRSLIDSEIVEKQTAPGLTKILFVGREAYRKGLDILIGALDGLPPSIRGSIELVVVSSMVDGVIPPPKFVSYTHHRELPFVEVIRLMQVSQIFAMPSRLESYGFTFIEAMANGCATLGPAWEVQRELMDAGRAGATVRPDEEEVRRVILEWIESPASRLECAIQGKENYLRNFSAPVVAQRFMNLVKYTIDAQ